MPAGSYTKDNARATRACVGQPVRRRGYEAEDRGPDRQVRATLAEGRGVARHFRASAPCGSITNFLAKPLSKSLYPLGASSKVMTVTLTALAILILS